MATGPLEVRPARLEGSYEQMDRRLGSIEERLGLLEIKIDAVADWHRRRRPGPDPYPGVLPVDASAAVPWRAAHSSHSQSSPRR